MMFSWMDSVRSWLKTAPRPAAKAQRKSRLGIETLEDRAVPSIVPGGQAPFLGPVPQWQQAGSGGIVNPLAVALPATSTRLSGGAAESISIDPFNPNHVAVGLVNGGVWTTDNYNTASPTWTTGTDALRSLAISTVAFSPVLPNVIYAGTGSYTNGGLGSNFGSGITAQGSGGAPGYLYKSADNGVTWAQVGGTSFGGRRIRDVVPTALNNGQTVFVALHDATTPTNTGIFRSDNGGTTWVRLSGANGLPALGVTDLIPDASNTADGSVATFYAAIPGAGGGVFMLDATNGNTAWKNISGNIPTALFANSIRMILASSPAGAHPVYVAYVDGNTDRVTTVERGVAYPAGNTYVWADIGPVGANGGGAVAHVNPGQQGETNLALAADPTNDKIIYLAGDRTPAAGVIASVARGDAVTNTWTTIALYPGPPTQAAPAGSVIPANPAPQPTTAPHPDSRVLVFTGNNTILLGGDGGVYQVDNPRAENNLPPVWDSRNGNLSGLEIYQADVDDRNNTDPTDDLYILGAQDNSTAEATLNGTYQVVTGGDGVLALADSVGGYRYYASQGFNLTRHDPNGSIIRPLARIIGAPGFTLSAGSGLTPIENMPFITSAVLNQSYPNEMIVGGTGTLYLSTDHADNFRSLFGFVAANTPNAPLPGQVTALAYGTVNTPHAVYVATYDYNTNTSAVLRSYDATLGYAGNYFFTDLPQISLGRQIIGMVMDPNNPLICYAATDSGVFKTTNGLNWTSITGNLISQILPSGHEKLLSITLITNNTPQTGDDAVVVGGYGGVFSLSAQNTAAGWTKFGTGMPNVDVTTVKYDARSDSLLAATYGRGTFVAFNAGNRLTPGLNITVTGDFNDNDLAIYPDLTDPQFFFVSDGLGNVQRFDSTQYKSVTFKGLSGADSLRVGSPNAATPGRSDLLTVNVIVDGGGSAGDALIVDDRADSTGRLVTTTSTLVGAGPGDTLMGQKAKIQYTGFNNGSVQFLFGTGSDELRYDDTANATAATYTLAGNRFTRSIASAPVTYTGLESFHVYGGSGLNTYQVTSTTATLGTAITDGAGNSVINVQGDGLTGANTFQGGAGNDTINLTAGAGLTGGVQVSGGAGQNTLNVTGRGSADAVVFNLTSTSSNATLAGFGQPVGIDTTQFVNFDGRGSNSFTWQDSSGGAFGTPTTPDTGVVYVPTGSASGRVQVNGGFTIPVVNVSGIGGAFNIGGDGAGNGPTDVLTVYGVSDNGRGTSAGETTTTNGQDTIFVSDSLVTVSNAILGALLPVNILTGGGGQPSFATLYLRAGNEAGPGGDTVTAVPSKVLNIVVDGMDPAGTTPGDRILIQASGSQTRTPINNPAIGPSMTQVIVIDGSSLGFLNFENSGGGPGGGLLAVGSGPGVEAEVEAYDPVTGVLKFRVFPFPGFFGGVSVASGDVTGDGLADLIVGAGPGGGPMVSVFDGNNGAPLGTVYVFESTFTGGVGVAAGDINKDGVADIVVGTGVGGGPRVVVLEGRSLTVIRDVFVYEDSFRGGVNVSVGDVNRDGVPDLITSTGSGGGPRVVVFDGNTLEQLKSFYAFDAASRDGFYATSGDVTGDGIADIIVGSGPGGPAVVKVYNGATGQLDASFFVEDPFDPKATIPNIPFDTGVRVTVTDIDGDGIGEIVTAKGPDSAPTLRFYRLAKVNPTTNAIEFGLSLAREQDVFNVAYSAGIYVGG